MKKKYTLFVQITEVKYYENHEGFQIIIISALMTTNILGGIEKH